MKVVLFGQAAFAEKVLEGLLARGHDVLAVYCPPDREGREDPLKKKAREKGIPVRQYASLKRPEVAEELRATAAELGVLAYVTQIVPREVFSAPRLGSICFHPSLLPAYRGGSAIPWQIIKGETRTGVTVFWVDEGIDTGPILLQREATIDPDDTAGTLYYRKLFPLGVEAVLDAVDLVSRGEAPRIPQDETKASYDPLCRDEHARVDWNRNVRELYDLVRGCDPQPGAHTEWKGRKLRFYDARPVEGTFRPGVVEALSPEGMVVGARGGGLRFGRLRWGEGEKKSAAEVAREIGLEVGSSLA
ncbi:MAG: methionyl-tRNA formyltransferase [Candidatus Binatia bacterium]|nr:MAG: methionyl-tRNA formyltransferase [Candidatus Binatia bacterium]